MDDAASGEPPPELRIAPPAPGMIQLSQVFFLFSALFSDVLLVRVCLTCGFLGIIIAALQSAVTVQSVQLDTFLWCGIVGSFHLRAAWTLIQEELPCAPIADELDSALYNYFHRRTGMLQRDFERVRAKGTWEMYKKDERICDTEMARHQLYIVIEGRVDIDFRYEGSATAGRVNVGSGECFDLRVLNVCGVYLGFHNEVFVATARTNCTCFVLPLDGLVELITKHGHFLAFMRTYALAELSRVAMRQHDAGRALDSFGQAEEASWATGARSRDFEPLRPSELESMRFGAAGLLRWLRHSLAPSVQPGMRHRSNPFSGSLAQASVRSKSARGLTDLDPATASSCSTTVGPGRRAHHAHVAEADAPRAAVLGTQTESAPYAKADL